METSPMVRELADLIRNAASRAGGRGMRISFEWLCDVLDGDQRLTRCVLVAAGFQPPEATEWRTGRGDARLADHVYPELLADRLTESLDYYAPV
ncbi:hypothetical protein [Pseudodonghicola sp.]|uniref:hypothetical protein n=1 Tax=Pseudodonghicola sp. TaxID=1969463 RepID=UPI003A97B9ED